MLADIARFLINGIDYALVFAALAFVATMSYRGFVRRRIVLPLGGLMVAGGLIAGFAAHIMDLSGGTLNLTPDNFGGTAELTAANSFTEILSHLAYLTIAVGLGLAVLSRRKIESELDSSRSQVVILESQRRSAELGTQYLFNSTSSSMYSLKFDPPIDIRLSAQEQAKQSYDGILTQCNDVFAQDIGKTKPDDIIGTTWSALENIKDRRSHESMFRDFVLNEYRLSNYELLYQAHSGLDRSASVNMVGMIRDNLLEQVWAVESAPVNHDWAQKALRRQERFQQLVAHISSRLLKATDTTADEIVERCLANLCAFVKADHAMVFCLNEHETIVSDYEFSRGGRVFDGELPLVQFPQLWKALQMRNSVRIDDIRALGPEFHEECRYLEAVGLQALLLVPMVVGDEVVGGMVVSRSGECTGWQSYDLVNVRFLSELLANFIMRLHSSRELSAVLVELEHTKQRLETENVSLREEVKSHAGLDGIIGKSPQMQQCMTQARQAAKSTEPVFLVGESGTGKAQMARAIHELSGRRELSLIAFSCSAFSKEMAAGELFGYEPRKTNHRDGGKPGFLEMAAGSTLLIEDIEELPLDAQQMLLELLQRQRFRRVGSMTYRPADARIIVAARSGLSQAVEDWSFLAELRDCLEPCKIEMPPLRDRGDDIELLAQRLARRHAQRLCRDVRKISAETMRQICSYDWPGNVRELDGVLERAVITSEGAELTLAEPLIKRETRNEPTRILSSTIPSLALSERDHIVSVLERVEWQVSGPAGAAQHLGMPSQDLRAKMRQLGIHPPS